MAFVTITPVGRATTPNNIQPYTSVRNLNANAIMETRDATATEISILPTALSAIVVTYTQYNQPNTFILYSASSAATLNAAIASAQSGVLGSGASGDATLVAGTVNVPIAAVTTNSKVLLTRHTVGGTVAATVQYQYVVTSGNIAITAAVAAGTINTADTSVITYAVVG